MDVLGPAQHGLRGRLPRGPLRRRQTCPHSQQRRWPHVDADLARPLRGTPLPHRLRLPQGQLFLKT